MDIGFGTTFELYLPNPFGILEFASRECIRNISKNAQKINLDFLDGIPINLANLFWAFHGIHKLNDNILADLEGRSSYARLEIEIHMTAGFIDPGFEGVLTFEIYNTGPSPAKIIPRNANWTIKIYKNEHTRKSYAKKHSAKYAGFII